MASEQTTKPILPIPFRLHWVKYRKKLMFNEAATYWTFGKRFVGKSSLGETIVTHHLAAGCTALDLFCSRDNESLGWCRSPYKNDVLLLVGNTVSLEFEKETFPWMRINEFSLKEAEKHKLVVTAPKFYSSEHEQYTALSSVVDMLKWREEFKKIIILVVREASRLLRARIVAGVVKSQMDAEYEMIDLLQESYHTGVAIMIDSLRPLSIEKSVREIANYTMIKRLGRQSLPDEFKFLMSVINPSDLRVMPIDQFVLWSDDDMIAIGSFDMVPWHIIRGESMMKSLGIKVKAVQSTTEITFSDAKRKVTREIHLKIVELRNEGLSFEKIANRSEVNLAMNTVRVQVQQHQKGLCLCNV